MSASSVDDNSVGDGCDSAEVAKKAIAKKQGLG
jgi:hypothetical protein